MKNKTTLIIAYRLSTLLEMDRFLAFDQRKMAQDGTHHKILKVNGVYKIL